MTLLARSRRLASVRSWVFPGPVRQVALSLANSLSLSLPGSATQLARLAGALTAQDDLLARTRLVKLARTGTKLLSGAAFTPQVSFL